MTIWNTVRFICWIGGLYLWWQLFQLQDQALLWFWHVLIALVPALVIFFPGLWRNICPMGTTTAYVARLTPYKKIFLSPKSQHRLAVIATVSLLLIVPLRHFLFDYSSQFTAAMLGIAGTIAIVTSLVFWDKSGWCAGLCPIHPVEKFYGISPAASFHNAQCPSCTRCVKSCPDAIKTPQHLSPEHSTFQERLMVGGFPGFVWGWFQIEDVPFTSLWGALSASYLYPFTGMAVSLFLFFIIKKQLSAEQHTFQRGRLLLVYCTYPSSHE